MILYRSMPLRGERRCYTGIQNSRGNIIFSQCSMGVYSVRRGGGSHLVSGTQSIPVLRTQCPLGQRRGANQRLGSDSNRATRGVQGLHQYLKVLSKAIQVGVHQKAS